MQIILSCAKTMATKLPAYLKRMDTTLWTSPQWEEQAHELIHELTSYSAPDIEDMLHVNNKIAVQNVQRYQAFFTGDALTYPAVSGYTGIVFKQLGVPEWENDMWRVAANHLQFTSFLYGMLRPTDLIHPYRLEGDVSLNCLHAKNVFHHWRTYLTDTLIARVQADDGILVFLASNEMRDLFDWKRVVQEVTVVTPEFIVDKGGKWKQVVVYTKMARGQMSRYLLQQMLKSETTTSQIDTLRAFSWEGYNYSDTVSAARAHTAYAGEELLSFVLG